MAFVSPVRAFIATVVVGLALVALWQGGVLFQPAADSTVDADGERLALLPADASIVTPDNRGLSVGLKQGELAPDFEFSGFDGKRQRLSDYRGQAVFLNFWATWCGPCRVELPDMQTLLDEFDGRLAILAVNNGERIEPAQRFVDDLELELTAFAYDPNQAIVKRYGLIGMPTSYFITPDGVVERVHTGQLSLAIMRSAVEDALIAAASR